MAEEKKTLKNGDTLSMAADDFPRSDGGHAVIGTPWHGVTTSTAAFPSSWMPAPAATSVRRPPVRTVTMPTKTSAKVLVAFLDDDDEGLWAKKLKPTDMHIDWSGDTSEAPTMTIEFSMMDIYDNE